MVNEHRKTFLKNSAAQYALQLAKYILPFVTLPYLTRVLGVEGYAVRAYVLAVMSFAQLLLEFGFNLHGAKLVAGFKDDVERVEKTIGSILASKLVLQIIGLPIIFGMCVAIPLMGENIPFTFLCYLSICFSVLMPDFIFMAYEKLGILTSRYVISKLLATVLTFALVKGPNDLWLVGLLDVISAFIALVLSFASLSRDFGLVIGMPSLQSIWASIKGSALYFLSNVSGTIMSSATTIAVGLWISDSAVVSYWSLGMTVANAVNALYTPLTNALYPHMINEYDQKLARRMLMLATPVALFIAAVVFFLSDQIMLLLGGIDYVAGSYVIACLAPLFFFGFPVILLGWPLLGAAGYVEEMTRTSLTATVLLLLGLGALYIIGAFSIVAVATLRCFCEFVLLAFRAIYVCKYNLLGSDPIKRGSK